MNINLKKIHESTAYVYYQALLSDVYEKINNQNDEYQQSSKYAIVKFNKNNNHIDYVWEETDKYYIENKSRALHMLALILGKMKRCNKEGYFPDKTGIATG